MEYFGRLYLEGELRIIPMGVNVKLSDDFVAEAKRYGAIHHRSLPR